MARSRFTGYVDSQHHRIYADSWLHLTEYSFREAPESLQQCYIWRVAKYSTRCLRLEGHGLPVEVDVPHEWGKFLRVFHPSRRVLLSDYPEEWGWWQGIGWSILLTDERDGGVLLQGRSGNNWLFIDMTPAAAAEPELARRWLQHALFAQIHPIKARKLVEPDGYYPQAEVDAMLRRLRRAER
jgi:hypothetical protein